MVLPDTLTARADDVLRRLVALFMEGSKMWTLARL